MFHHDCPLAVKPASMPRRLVHKKTWRDSVPIDMLLSAVFILVVAQPEVPEGGMNYSVYVEPNNGLKRLKRAGHIIIPKDVLIIYLGKVLILSVDKIQQYKIQCNKIHTLIIPLPPARLYKYSSSLTSSV